ncbi:MAG: cupin domain-containing protein [Acidimicrobiia bacterium]|nr:cupin domain-containing protein [Acidimicrobiia bacterium]
MCFICLDDVEWEELDWGELGWVMRPANVPEGSRLCALDVKLDPGKGHDFHTHPNQEEIILLRSGTVEQWVKDERRQLTAGDACFIPIDTVHATFVADDAPEAARLFVVLGPSHGPDGYEAVDVSSQEPWASIR